MSTPQMPVVPSRTMCSGTIPAGVHAEMQFQDELVMEKCAELVSKMPEDYVEDAFKDRIVRGMGGLGTFAASRSPRCPRRRRILELRAHPAYLPLCSSEFKFVIADTKCLQPSFHAIFTCSKGASRG